MGQSKVEITITDGKINPYCHVVSREQLFDADGNPVGVGKKHRATVSVSDIDLTADPKLKLTDAEATAITETITAAKGNREIWTPPDQE